MRELPIGMRPDPHTRRLNTQVLIDGQPVDVDSWQITGQTATDLPAQVRGASGHAVMSGDVSIPPQQPVVRPGDLLPWVAPTLVDHQVVIRAGWDGQSVTLFEGKGFVQSGSARQTSRSLNIVDHLGVPDLVGMVGLMAKRQLVESGSGWVVVNPGISPAAAISHLLEVLGYYAGPPPRFANLAGSWGFQGTTIGRGPAGERTAYASSGSEFVERTTFPGQAWRGGGTWLYAPTWAAFPSSLYAPGLGSNLVGFGGLVEPGGTTTIQVTGWERQGISEGNLEIYIDPAGALTLEMSDDNNLYTATVTLNEPHFEIVFGYDGPDYKLWVNGQDVSPAWGGAEPWPFFSGDTYMFLKQQGGGISGLWWGWEEYGPHNPPPTPAYEYHPWDKPTQMLDLSLNTIEATPPMYGQPLLELLHEICAAENAVLTIKEGTARWQNAQTLATKPAITVLTEEHIHDIHYAQDPTQTYDRVEIPITPLQIEISLTGTTPRADQIAWEAGSIIEVPAGETIVMTADLDHQVMGLSEFVAQAETDPGQGSWVRATRPLGSVQAQLEGQRLTITIVGGADDAVIATPGGSPSLRVRAAGLVTLGEMVTISAGETSDQTRVLRLPQNPWMQDIATAQTTANRILTEVSQVRPVITSMEIVPDLRIERGDVIELDCPRLNLTGRFLVTGESLTGQPGQIQQTLSLRELREWES